MGRVPVQQDMQTVETMSGLIHVNAWKVNTYNTANYYYHML